MVRELTEKNMARFSGKGVRTRKYHAGAIAIPGNAPYDIPSEDLGIELREDGGEELREDMTSELREDE